MPLIQRLQWRFQRSESKADGRRVVRSGVVALAAILLTTISLCDLDALEFVPSAGAHSEGHHGHEQAPAGSPSEEGNALCCSTLQGVLKKRHLDREPITSGLAYGPAIAAAPTSDLWELDIQVESLGSDPLLFRIRSPAYFLASPAHAPPPA